MVSFGAASIWRDFVVDGNPASGAHKPIKAEIQTWGQEVEQRDVDTKADLEGLSVVAPVLLVRTGGYATLGDGGGAHYKRAGAEPAHNLKVQSADLAWWELVPTNNVITFQACGGIEGDDAANGAANVTAFNNFIGYAQALFADGITADGPTLMFPKGDYHFNNHLNVKAAVRIVGAGGWTEGTRTGSVLRFATDKNGFIVQAQGTIDETTESPDTFTGLGTIFDGLHLIGGGFGNATGHGIWMRASALIRNCFVTQFGLDGVHIVANIGSGGATEGNANGWRIEHCIAKRNGRHGLYVDDADANAGYALGFDAGLNARWGIFDSSLLGNTYIACQTQTNGVANTAGNAADASSYVSFGGNRYSANVGATEAQLVATTPGTDQTIWILRGSGGVGTNIPLWVAAKPEGTYFHGGPYHTDGVGASSEFTGCYREDNQGECQILAPSAARQGEMQSNKSTGFFQRGIPTGAKITGQVTYSNDGTFFETSTRKIEMIINRGYEKAIRLDIDADFLTTLGWDDADKNWILSEYANSPSARAILVTSGTTVTKSGRASELSGGEIIFGQGIFLGDHRNNSRHMTNGIAAPTTGEHAQGEAVINRSAAAGAVVIWFCVASGTPGTWVELRGLANQTTGAAQAALTDNTGGTPDQALAAVPAGGTGTAAGGWDSEANRDAAIAAINDNIADLAALLDEIRTTLVGAGLMKGSA